MSVSGSSQHPHQLVTPTITPTNTQTPTPTPTVTPSVQDHVLLRLIMMVSFEGNGFTDSARYTLSSTLHNGQDSMGFTKQWYHTDGQVVRWEVSGWNLSGCDHLYNPELSDGCLLLIQQVGLIPRV